ncbi:toxin-antitoxin system YwqK family antitoxin [Tenacibaculum sp. M341]|uniref:toxin-antitoxin system YwqK family antitoxin n=2 Tax=Tenacibaculum TaxID=104267 RepID=UPI0010528487|nr:toxin-antitoxin system YwqK family antitoxin [Tenacibaculum sp. M341]TCI94281.1 toxin-antitoxin system YwqK family antitoxin [Tenacibaculum sp. M341]
MLQIFKYTIALFLMNCQFSFAQVYMSWNDIETKRFGKETIFSSREDKKPLNGAYKLSENSGAYADISFKNGKIDGIYTSYDFSGNKISEATYKEGKIEGTQKSYFQNGTLQEKTNYKNGLKEGTWTTYNRKGEVIRTETYKKDNKEGKWMKRLKNPAENTTSIVLEYYKNNEPTGTWEERLTDGKLKWEKTYSAKTDYIEKKYHLNGKLSVELTVRDRRKNGIAKYFTPEGILEFKVNYDNDHVVYKEEYFINGILKSKTNYKYGSINGLYESYNEEGIKLKEGKFVDTYKNGVWKTYEKKKGRLFSEITYQNDSKNGIAKYYHTKSKSISMEGKYLNNKQHGIWKHYDLAGELTKEVEFNKGKQISEKSYN